MNIIDIIIVLLLIMAGLVGFKKGALKEAVSLVGIILVFVIAFSLKGYLGNILCKYLPFFNFTGNLKGVVTLNILMYQLIAFFIIYSILFSIYAIVLKLSGIAQKLVNMTIVLLLPSKIIGFIIAFIEGYIITFIVLLTLMIPLKGTSMITESALANKIIYNSPIISKSTSNITNSITEIYDLGDNLSKNEISTNDANLKALDIMLKYKIVTPKTVEQLIVLDKLNSVKGTEAVINKYK